MPPSSPYLLMPLTPAAPGFGDLLAESRRGGFRMLERLRDGWASGSNRFEQRGEILLGAFTGTRLIGAGGRTIDPFAGDRETGRVRHLYVAEAFRRAGIGRLLVDGILADAGAYFRRLHVRAPADAFGFYEHLGFRPVMGIDTVTHEMIL
ncbi:GNAT family N-acetyltransferase [Taklimakanibacter lacteus]|uniref:GNAT family N-acetyltransferase n=1 Tax=Taklimakanibacter lacteus TaxID=2268456 RepID=UPI000E66C3CA